jgi:hypothetical protein
VISVKKSGARPLPGCQTVGYSAKMNRKRREANARRALAAGRRARPSPSELAVTDLLRDKLEVEPGSMDALNERTEARVPAARGA